MYQNEIVSFFDARIEVLKSFIPIRSAIPDLSDSTYKFQCVTLLKFESHE
jgi:hypothetical protein